jgi:hypothetical protein
MAGERRVRTRGPSGNETRHSAWRGKKFFHHEGTKITKTIRDARPEVSDFSADFVTIVPSW